MFQPSSLVPLSPIDVQSFANTTISGMNNTSFAATSMAPFPPFFSNSHLRQSPSSTSAHEKLHISPPQQHQFHNQPPTATFLDAANFAFPSVMSSNPMLNDLSLAGLYHHHTNQRYHPYQQPRLQQQGMMDPHSSAFRPLGQLGGAVWPPQLLLNSHKSLTTDELQHLHSSLLLAAAARSNTGPNATDIAKSQPVAATLTSQAISPMKQPQPPISSSSPSKSDCHSTDALVRTLKTFLLPQRSLPCSTISSASTDDSECNNSQMLAEHKNGDDVSDHCSSVAADCQHAAFDGTTVLCQVCGDKASGFHYGVHACEGCKVAKNGDKVDQLEMVCVLLKSFQGFFRRSIQQKIQTYRPCTKSQQCQISRINRNRCQACRLKKCVSVGMSRDAVRFGRVPKQEKQKIMEEMQRASVKSHVGIITAELEDSDRLMTAVITAHLHTCEMTRGKLIPLLDQLRRRGLSSEAQPTSSIACPLNPRRPLSPGHQHEEVQERYQPVIQSVVEFAKAVPGFQLLSQPDQVIVLKAGLFEILLLRLAVMFDSDKKSFMLLDGTVFRRDDCPPKGAITSDTSSQCPMAHGRYLVDSTFDFLEQFNAMALTDAEIAVYCAIVLFTPDRPGLHNPELVTKINELLRNALRKVLGLHHPDQPALFDRLLLKLPDLRTLSTLHQEKLMTFTTDLTGHEKPRSTSASNRTNSPCSAATGEMLPASNHNMTGASHWSTACKASEGTPSEGSTSPSAPLVINGTVPHTTGDDGKAEKSLAADVGKKLSGLHPSTGLYPVREASSFDSGKGTLSHKASSSSDTDSDDGHHHHHRGCQRVSSVTQVNGAIKAVESLTVTADSKLAKDEQKDSMPALKRALLAPPRPITPEKTALSLDQQLQHQQLQHQQQHQLQQLQQQQQQHQQLQQQQSIRDRHRVIASLLERPPTGALQVNGTGRPMVQTSLLQPVPQHQPLTATNSRFSAERAMWPLLFRSEQQQQSAAALLMLSSGGCKANMSSHRPAAAAPFNPPISSMAPKVIIPSAAHTSNLSPKRPYPFERDDQPLNLCKKDGLKIGS